MDSLSETAIGVVHVLASGSAPRPLPVDLRDFTLPEARNLVEAIIRECAFTDVPLVEVRMEPELAAALRLERHDVYIGVDEELGNRVEFWVKNRSGSETAVIPR